VEQGLVGLGWSVKEASNAVAIVAQDPLNEEEVSETHIAELLKRALRVLASK
jgi:Holliday junction resolvasome RuvABC DNA-binding subunit